MSTPILTTKLYIPPPQPKVVLRPRLIECLNEGLDRKLSLISAPAGSGKTTLLSEWLAGRSQPAAWLSLDEGDNDPTRFLAYLVAALRTIAPNIGEGLLGALQSPQPPPTESVLTALLNEITTVPDKFVLVLDDYHVIDARPVDDALAFLIEHLPPRMHLVIATREDPNLPLARLRARGQLGELRAADLRFTPSEAAEFLEGVMGLSLSAEDVAALETRTEGWIAGLQLAALSMRGREDVSGFVRAFAGDNRYIVDYLVEEVLQRQPEHIRSFLLETSILDRLGGPLCDAVTGQADGRGMLETLERGNLFVVPLDDERRWYRYHHLFADVLQARLAARHADRVAELHAAASRWLAENGLLDDAVRHAIASGDHEHTADLVELTLADLRRRRQDRTIRDCLVALPDDVVRRRPLLAISLAWSRLSEGDFDGVEAWLDAAEAGLDTTPPSTIPTPVSLAEAAREREGEVRSIPAMAAVYRASVAQARGDVDGTVAHARRALALAGPDDHFPRGAAAGFVGLAAWATGDLGTAVDTFSEAVAS